MGGFGKGDQTGSGGFDDFGGVVTRARFEQYKFGAAADAKTENGLVLTIRLDSGFETRELFTGGKEFGTPTGDGLGFSGSVGRQSKIAKLVDALEKQGVTVPDGTSDPRFFENINAHWERTTIEMGKDKATGQPVKMKVLLPVKLRQEYKSKEAASEELKAAVDPVIATALKDAGGSLTKGALVGKIFGKLPADIRQKGAELATEETYLASEGRPWKYDAGTLSL